MSSRSVLTLHSVLLLDSCPALPLHILTLMGYFKREHCSTHGTRGILAFSVCWVLDEIRTVEGSQSSSPFSEDSPAFPPYSWGEGKSIRLRM